MNDYVRQTQLGVYAFVLDSAWMTMTKDHDHAGLGG